MSKNQNVVKQQCSNIDPASLSIPRSPGSSFSAANDGDFNSFGISAEAVLTRRGFVLNAVFTQEVMHSFAQGGAA